MSKYILKRIGISIIVLLIVLLILFVLLEFMPGSPFNDEKLTDEQKMQLYEKYRLNDDVVTRYIRYVKNMLKGDFGISYNISKNTPITELLDNRLGISFQIGLQSILLGLICGISLGFIAGIYHNTKWDTIASIISVVGVSIPSYVFALGLAYYFGFELKIFPLLYSKSKPFISTILPSVALSMFTMASIARYTRNEVIEILNSDYILLAKSKGMTGFKLIYRHVFRNALIQIITVLAPLIVSLMTGSLVVEKIFSIPGIGSLWVTAIQSNDYNVVIILSFIYSLMYIVMMLIVDVCYGLIDPRIRFTKEVNDDK